MTARIGIVTVSDRASRGEYEDRGGPAIHDELTKILTSPWEPVVRVIPDERDRIEATLIELVDRERCCLVVTTGGTGPATRDVTPEATANVIDLEVPGMAEAIRAQTYHITPFSMVSRARVGVRGKTLIVNLPGSPKGAVECLEVLLPVLPHAFEVLQDRRGPHPVE